MSNQLDVGKWDISIWTRIFDDEIFSSATIRPESEDGTIDSDVMNEKNRIRSMTSYADPINNLIVKDITKIYGSILAVNQICVGVKKLV